VTVLADSFDGKRLNSPNDVIAAPDGSLWFRDPHCGIMRDYTGFRAVQELPCAVYRVDAAGGIEAMIADMACPNGLAFSPDGMRLYVADTGRMLSTDPQHFRIFDIVAGRPVNGRVFHTISPAAPMASVATATATFGPQPRTGCIAPPRTGI
jgi:gluconolactonase